MPRLGGLGTAFGRMGAGGKVPAAAAAAGPANAETTTWVNAVVGDGGSVSAGRQTSVDTLITSLKSGGVWTSLDRLFLFAAENSQSALRDICAAAAATVAGGPTFTADRGYTGTDNSSTVYIDSGFNPSTGTPNYTQNSAHISVWSNTNATSAAGGVSIGAQVSGASGQDTEIFPKFSDGKAYYRINDTSLGVSGGVANADSTGYYVANRSGAATQQGYRNAVDQGIVAVSSAAIPNGNFIILGWIVYPAGTHKTGDAHQNCGVTIGGSLTSGQVTSLYNALRTYMTAVGVP